MGMRGGGRERRELVAEVQKLEKAAADDPIQIARQEAIFERRKERGMERRRRKGVARHKETLRQAVNLNDGSDSSSMS
jgi:hypothetical protein